MFRLFLSALLGLVAFSASAQGQWDNAQQAVDKPVTMTVYRDPDCQCCHKWIQHLEQHNITVFDKLTRNMADIKQQANIPSPMRSCHTAQVGDYVIEGHVPAQDILKLLQDKPDIAGLAVPNMPVGTPGMEMGMRKDNFVVFQFNKAGQISVFDKYQVDAEGNYHSSSSKD